MEAGTETAADVKVKRRECTFENSRKNHIKALESKLAKIKVSSGSKSATSMISALKMAREDSARLLISQSESSTSEPSEEPLSFLDRLYSTNTLYRHMFPATQALGTDEKEILLKNDELSKFAVEEVASDDVTDGSTP